MRIVVYVGGIKGVGKSTLFSKLLAHSLVIDMGYERAKVAEKMFELLQIRGVIKQYEELETINIELQNEVRLNAFKEILKNQKSLLFDGHYAISSPYGYSYGIPLEVAKKIDYFILLYNSPRVILERRRKDAFRKRELDLLKIELDLRVEEAFARFYAEITGKTLIKIRTDNKALDKMIKLLKEVSENA